MKRERSKNQIRLAVAPLQGVEVRDASATGDGSWTIEGYAAVFEQETTLWDIAGWWRVDEEIAVGAFDNVLERVGYGGELVHLNHGHDMKTAMAASDVRGIGGLELSADFHGLRYFARVDPEDPDVRAAASKMRRRIVRQSSFAFTVGAEELVESRELDDGTWLDKWRILEVGHLYDVCVCAQGAYPQTESAITERVAGLAPLEASKTARSMRRARSTYLEAAARASLARTGLETRADVAALDLLVDAYELVEDFIAIETEDTDAADREAANGILDTLDGLIVAEAAEPADPADADLDPGEMGRTPAGVGRHGRREHSRGRDRAAPNTAGGGEPEQKARAMKAQAEALTETLLRRTQL